GSAAAGRERREVVIVGRVDVEDVEGLARNRAGDRGDVPESSRHAVRAGQQGPRPARRLASSFEVVAADEGELRLDARLDQRLRPIVHHGGDAGPLLTGDDVEHAHWAMSYLDILRRRRSFPTWPSTPSSWRFWFVRRPRALWSSWS